MYRDPVLWARIRHRVLVRGISGRQVSRETGIDTRTIRKMLSCASPPARKKCQFHRPKLGPHTSTIGRLLEQNRSLPRSARLSVKKIYEHIRDLEGFSGNYRTVADYVRPRRNEEVCIWSYAHDLLTSLDRDRAIDFLFMLSRADPPVISESKATKFFQAAASFVPPPPKPNRREVRRQGEWNWMDKVIQGLLAIEQIKEDVGAFEGVDELLRRLPRERFSERNKALAVLASYRGISSRSISKFLGIDPYSCRKYLRTFDQGSVLSLFARRKSPRRKSNDEAIKQAVFALLHEPPANHGINRTTWKMQDFRIALRARGCSACPDVIRAITKAAGYRWRKARTVLTSTDPDYTAKLARINSILSQLRPEEAFFSIDEFGPFAVNMKGGRSLVPASEQRIIPQWQRSKGCLILTAALELSGNQVTHFYSTKKNTVEMIRMTGLLVQQYMDRRKLYLSWDAASWHLSKRLEQHIELHNSTAAAQDLPIVETVPLPSGAQFLNVIESVFSGMARAIIHNSDYGSIDEAKAAIDRYYEERNARFRRNPRRAGKKIWRKERERSEFNEGNNCKDPYYR
jgi:transposase